MFNPTQLRAHQYIYIILLGATFSVLLSRVWSLEPRWFIVVVAGIVLLSISMMFSSKFSDFITISFLFVVPLSGFEKWLFLGLMSEETVGSVIYSGLVGIGPLEFVLVGMYASWFFRVYVDRTAPPFTFVRMDYWVLALLSAYILSIWDSPSPMMGAFAVEYLLKHILVYFYLSRNLKTRHIKWLILAVFAAIILESSIGIVQNRTPYLHGLARDKGALDTERQSQYYVPGIEEQQRAEGTLYDSHALGLYFAMMLPLPFLIAASKGMKARIRAASAFVFMLGIAGLITTFSRSAWLSFFISFLFMLMFIHFKWREKHIIPVMVIFSVPGVLVSPWVLDYVYTRFSSAPIEILTTRFEQYGVALDVWLDNFLFGYGVGNYLEALKLYNYSWALELPVHNVFLWNAAETGLFGVLTFYGMIIYAIRILWKIVTAGNGLEERLSLAFLIALFAYLLDGLTDPLFREPVVYMMFWVIISVAVCLGRKKNVID